MQAKVKTNIIASIAVVFIALIASFSWLPVPLFSGTKFRIVVFICSP